ncbi:MAG TPA: hypothetical protein VF651_06455 [Gammaproteobacteria bacterium]
MDRSSRVIRLACLVGALSLAACASQGHKQEAAAAPGGEQKSEKPLITRSAVFFPGETADLELYQKYVYPDAPNGVQMTYRSKALPEARIDFFVFVLGRGSQAQGLKAGDERMRYEIQAATKAGKYEDLKFTDESDFPVTEADGSTLPGRRLLLTMNGDGRPLASAGYMFYKQLYLIEIRITDAAKAEDMLRQVGDQAARQVVPLIHILNEGDCQNVTAYVGDNVTPQSLLAAMQDGIKRSEADGCPTHDLKPADFQPKEGEDVLMLNYKSEDWR